MARPKGTVLEKKKERFMRFVLEFNKVYSECIKSAVEEGLYNAIDTSFYSDPKLPSPFPKKYDRNYNLYNSIKVKSRVNKYTGMGELYYKVSSDSMKNWYTDSKEYVYEGAIVLGYHGSSKIFVSSPSPIVKMAKFLRGFKKDKYVQEAAEIAMKNMRK